MTKSHHPVSFIAALACLALLAGGCGQKGPLYLERPEPRQPIAAAPKKKPSPAPAAAPAQNPEQQTDQVEQSFPQKEQF